MATALDRASIAMTVESAGAAADFHVGTEKALLHCTRNVNKGTADGNAGKVTTGRMMTVKADVLITTDPNSTADRNDALVKWDFGFLQIATIKAYKFVYAGRMANEGGMRMNFKNVFVPNPCLDADETLPNAPFVDTAVTRRPVTVPRPGVLVHCEAGDNPSTIIDHTTPNPMTKAPNFLFSATREEEFSTVLVATSPDGIKHFIASVAWSVAWDAEFRWKAGAASPIVLVKRKSLGPFTVTKGSGPSQTDLHPLLLDPKGPTANELDAKAFDQAFTSRNQAVLETLKIRPQEIPSDFFT